MKPTRINPERFQAMVYAAHEKARAEDLENRQKIREEVSMLQYATRTEILRSWGGDWR